MNKTLGLSHYQQRMMMVRLQGLFNISEQYCLLTVPGKNGQTVERLIGDGIFHQDPMNQINGSFMKPFQEFNVACVLCTPGHGSWYTKLSAFMRLYVLWGSKKPCQSILWFGFLILISSLIPTFRTHQDRYVFQQNCHASLKYTYRT